jgi:diguanylate cyclase (GGDEF)-like protein/PAS domain S-box-containing protein
MTDLMNNIDQRTGVFVLTLRFQSRDGRYRYIELKGNVQGAYIYCVARDMSDWIELEQSLKRNDALLQTIMDNAPVSIYINYPGEEPDYYNRYMLANYAMTKEESLLSGLTDEDVLQKGFQGSYEEEITFKDGKKHIIETVKSRLYKDDGSVLGTLGIGIDITKRKEDEEALRMSESKYRLLTETTSDAIWVYNLTSKRFTYVSPTIQMLRGYTVEESMEQTLEDMVDPEYYPIILDAFDEALKDFHKNPNTTKSTMIEARIICKNGKRIWSEMSARLRLNQSNEIEVVGISRNIENRKQYEREVLYLSYHDQLTGLYNRRYYEEELKNINSEGNYPITLVMADVNGLKLTNDAFGHVFGDRMLVAIADILKKECRSGDVIARIGGDEFVLLLHRTNSIQAERIVERIQNIMSNTMVDNVRLSVSFGWKTKYMLTEEFDDIYKQAEDAMYRRKMLEGKSYKSDTIKLITQSLYEKCKWEQQHCERVSVLCRELGTVLGMDADDVNELGLTGLLHDIGKIGINKDILNKTEELTEEEWQEIKRHPEIGYHILRSVNEFAELAEYVLAHHERIDGKGYPYGLRGADIPQKAKILHVAEAYENMTGECSYRKKMSQENAVLELKKNAGQEFDDVIIRVFIEKVLKKEY